MASSITFSKETSRASSFNGDMLYGISRVYIFYIKCKLDAG
jgi:hypothetical protein